MINTILGLYTFTSLRIHPEINATRMMMLYICFPVILVIIIFYLKHEWFFLAFNGTRNEFISFGIYIFGLNTQEFSNPMLFVYINMRFNISFYTFQCTFNERL